MPEVTRILLLLQHADESLRRFNAFFAERFPQARADIVDHYSKLKPLIDDADVLMSFGRPLGPDADRLVGGAPKLKWIQSLGTGVDNIVDLPSLRREVVVTNMHGIHGASMSEAAIFLMMALGRDFPRVTHNQDKRVWDRWPAHILNGRTVGILGVGAIATALAPRCKALGMTVIGITSSRREIAGFDAIRLRRDLPDAVRDLDFLVLLVPYSPHTHHIVDARLLAAMKPSAYLVNLARGGLVDEDALIVALEGDQIAGAALDVFSEEPLPSWHRLWSTKNVIVTPHLGGYADDYHDQAFAILDRNLRSFLAGNAAGMINIVKR